MEPTAELESPFGRARLIAVRWRRCAEEVSVELCEGIEIAERDQGRSLAVDG